MTTTATPLAAWLGQVLDAREAAARAATHQKVGGPSHGNWVADSAALMAGGILDRADRAHIAANDPAAVLAMVEGLRAIVALHVVGDPDEWGPEQWACRLCQWDEDCDSPKQSYQHGAGRYPCPTLRHVAAMFASEPGYDEAVGS